MSFIHIVCVPFLYFDGPPEFFHDSQIVDYKFKLFEYITVESLKNQTDKNFHVIVATSECFKERVEELIKKIKVPYKIYTKDLNIESPNLENVKEYTKDLVFDTILTTRLDGDDAFYPEYISETHKWLNSKYQKDDFTVIIPKEYTVFDIPNKCFYNILNERRCYSYTIIQSNKIEKIYIRHTKLYNSSYKHFYFGNSPLFFYTNHYFNTSNSISFHFLKMIMVYNINLKKIEYTDQSFVFLPELSKLFIMLPEYKKIRKVTDNERAERIKKFNSHATN